MKRKIIIAVIVLVLLGLGVWFIFGRSSIPGLNTLTNVSPFGSGAGSVESGGNHPGGSGTGLVPGAPLPHLFQITDQPIAGATALVKSGAMVVRYVERATGHIYDVDPTSLAKTEIVNTTIPKVYEAVFNKAGNAVILRTLKEDGETINSALYTLIPPTGTSTADLYTTRPSALVANISEMAVGPNDIFYTLRGLPQIKRALFDGSNPTTVWSADFNNWQLSGAEDSAVLITSKASAGVDGFAYQLSASGSLTKLLGPLSGLVTLADSNLKHVAFSTSNGTDVTLHALTLATGASVNLFPATLAEKCVWSPEKEFSLYCASPLDGVGPNEPDMWYQGRVHFSDRIWLFDTDTGSASLLADPKNFNTTIDAEHLFLSPAEDYLFFENRNDLTLWALKLD